MMLDDAVADPSQLAASVSSSGLGAWWPRARPHVEILLDASPEELRDYCRSTLADEPELRREVRAFLGCRTRHRRLIDCGAEEAVPSLLADLADIEPTDVWCGRQVGPWRLHSVLGRGGMAVVYRVTREGDGYTQEAALKWLQVGCDSPSLRARFRMEQRVLARLRHPGISALIDGGVSADGRPYLVMELVEGRPLVDYCQEHDLGLDDRLRLMIEICDAVSYAHHRLVIHRDLKPANVMVTGSGSIKLLDFGIAKVLDAADAPQTLHSAPMTPAYASPEQRQAGSITTVSDVYSLGLLLWQLVVGQRCPEQTPESAPLIPPSRVALGLGRQASPQLARDLDSVVMHCLEQYPDDRYSSAEALAADLENLLAAQPVTTRKISSAERFRRWTLRNKVASTAVSMALLFLVVGAVTSSAFGYRAHHQRLAALQEANKSRAAMVFLEGLLATSQASPQVGDTINVRELLSEAEQRLDDDLRDHPTLQRDVLPLMTRVYRSFSLHDEAVATAEQELALVRRHDEDVIEHALAQRRLGYELIKAGNHIRAAEELAAATALLRQELGDRAPEVLDTMRVESYAVGLRPFRQTMEIRRLVLEGELHNAAGADSPRVAQALNDYGRVLYYSGYLDLAAADLEDAYAMRLRLALPPLDLVVSNNNLSMVRLAQGRLQEAEDAAREALRLAQEIEGRGHPLTGTPLLHLAGALRAQGSDDEAFEVAREALAIRRHYLPNHTRLADVLILVGALLCEHGDFAQAEALLAEARVIKVESFTAVSWRVGEVDGERGRCQALQGETTKARELLEAGLEVVIADLGSRSPIAGNIQSDLDDLSGGSQSVGALGAQASTSSKRDKNRRASRESRLIVGVETPRISAVSTVVKPPKKRSSQVAAKRGS